MYEFPREMTWDSNGLSLQCKSEVNEASLKSLVIRNNQKTRSPAMIHQLVLFVQIAPTISRIVIDFFHVLLAKRMGPG